MNKLNIDNYAPCPCGSKKKYKFCCRNVVNEIVKPWNDIHFTNLINQHINKSQLKQCLHPLSPKECSKGIIRAHSIHNKGVLSNISENNHVLMKKIIIYGGQPIVELKEIGVNNATIFLGFCNYHDTTAFKSIETQEYENSPEQNFYYAYRAFCFETHKKQEEINGLKNLVGKFPQILNKPHIIQRYKYIKYNQFDIIENNKFFKDGILSQDYSTIYTDVYEYSIPSQVAVTCGFYLLSDLNGNPINTHLSSHTPQMKRAKFLFLTFFPQGDKSYVLLSCLREDFKEYESLLTQIKTLDKTQRAKFFSRIAILKSQNIVLKPTYWKRLDNKSQVYINSDINDLMHEDVFDGIENFTKNVSFNFFQMKI